MRDFPSSFPQALRYRLRDRRFWIVQLLVITIAAAHTTLETLNTLNHSPDLYLLPISTFFIPVLYAALNFGIEGALPTGAWCALLTAPNIVVFHHGAERAGVSAQLTLLVVLGAVVARRVDRERAAKLTAEAANARLVESQRALHTYIGMALSAQEEERHRLSRELHDETIQDLLVVKAALQDLCRENGERARLEMIDVSLQKSIDEIRSRCRALRPSILDDLGLVAALESLLTEMRSRIDIAATFVVEGTPERLDPDRELAVFRIVQEALHNVERHARAGSVTLRISYDPDRLVLTVEDDGRGFDPAAVGPDSLGLSGMQERAHLIGARLEIASRPDGSRIRLAVPIDRAAPVAPREAVGRPV